MNHYNPHTNNLCYDVFYINDIIKREDEGIM